MIRSGFFPLLFIVDDVERLDFWFLWALVLTRCCWRRPSALTYATTTAAAGRRQIGEHVILRLIVSAHAFSNHTRLRIGSSSSGPQYTGLVNSLIIQDYDLRWPQLFETLRSRIETVIPGMAATIEHVGSTAVPGLAAKPIIDLDVLLISATDLTLVIAKLASVGYEHRGDLGIAGREAFRTPPNDLPHHLYVCPSSSPEYSRHISFRDYLRTHPADASSYASLKRELVQNFGDDREAYTQAKSRFVAEILRRVDKTSIHTEREH